MALTRFSVAPLHTLTRTLAAVAMGREAPDLVLTGARLLSTYTERIHPEREIWLKSGRIAAVKPAGTAKKLFTRLPRSQFFDAAGGILAPGLVAVMVLVPSMTADLCDLDEVTTGARREGMFNAVLGWMLKVALSGSLFLAGLALSLTGWDTALKAAQTPATFLAMRIAFSTGTIVLALGAAALIAGYKVTEADVAASRRRG
jgi:Na+/melibiose symporter-like transporter